MGILYVLLLFFWNISWAAQPGTSNLQLDPNGKNVCSKEFTYQSYYYKQLSYTGYENYRACCKKFIWCTSHCMKYRETTRYYTNSFLRYKKRTSYFCCPGWARVGSACPQAICVPPCENGECIAPDTCKCASKGFTGKYCEKEINECLQKPSPCDQGCTDTFGDYSCYCRKGFRRISADQHERKCQDIDECAVANKSGVKLCKCAYSKGGCNATCLNTVGSYKCTCSPGYRLVANRVCTDSDECASGESKCAHICWNTRGGYRCTCYTGYKLAKDNHSCEDIDECKLSNANCDQLCINNVGSFSCGCKKGYQLDYEGFKCNDINECERSRPCDRYHGICENRIGNYSCGCKLGYELQYDGKTCKDIDECKRLNLCQQECVNSDGSYLCSCRFGFKLGSNGKSCDDIDECSENLHSCQHKCTNTYGSYKCSCRKGFFLAKDGYSCIGAPCKSLYSPHNGNIKCSGFFVGDTCSFECNPGFENKGVASKTCQEQSRWSDGNPNCVPQKCPEPFPPDNGILILPCLERYRSTCIIKCKKGFKILGKNLIKCTLDDGKSEWRVNATCQDINLCKPNPCYHDGKCVMKSLTAYECDCSNTGYSGNNCERGIVKVPEFPQIEKGVESEEFLIQAKPDRKLVIKLTTEVENSVKFSPSDTFTLHPPGDKITFRLTSLRTGFIRLRYNLFGPDSLNFDQPNDGVVYVFASESKKRLSNIANDNFMKEGCNKIKVEKCFNGSNIVLSSYCAWTASGSLGYVSVNYEDINLPLSLAGVKFAASESITQFAKKGSLTVSKLTQEMLINGKVPCPAGSCPNLKYNYADNQFILKRNNFLRSYYSSVNDVTPWWISYNLPINYDGFHINDIQSLLLKAQKMNDFRNYSCPNLPSTFNGNSIYSVLVTRAPFELNILGDSKVYDSSYPTCVVLELCRKFTYLSLPRDMDLDITDYKNSQNRHALNKVKVKGLGFSYGKSLKKICARIWNGISLHHTSFCIHPRLWFKSDILFNSGSAYLDFQGEVYSEPKRIEAVMTERFNMEQKSYMQGSLSGKISVRVHGKNLNFIISDPRSTIVTQLGGSKEKCIMCSTKGIHLTLQSSNVQVDYETSSLYLMLTKSNFHSHIYYNLLEGYLLSTKDVPRISMRMRIVNSIPKLLRSLKGLVRKDASKYKIELAYLAKVSSSFESKVNRVSKMVSGRDLPKYEEILSAVNNAKKEASFVKDALTAFKDALTITGFKNMRRLTGKAKSIENKLRILVSLTVNPELAPVSEITNGLSVSYFGQLCVHSLCFSNNIISIFDVKDDISCFDCWKAGNLSENLYITAISEKKRKLGPYFLILPNSKVEIQMSKDRNDFFITFPATVSVFNKTVNTTVRIDKSQFEFSIKNVSIGYGSEFDIIAKSDFTLSSTWESVLFTYHGKPSNSKLLLKMFERVAFELLKNISESTIRRIEISENKQKLSESLVKKYNKDVKYLKAEMETNKNLERIANRKYFDVMNKFTNDRKNFRSQQSLGFLKKLDELLDKECKKKVCGTKCHSMQLHDICQEKVIGFAYEYKCEKDRKKVSTTVEEPFETDCALTKKIFQPIYTGTCAGAGQKKLKGSLAASGAAIGALVGSAVPVVGTAIGAFVGFLASKFSSCDKTWEIAKKSINYQKPCVLKVFNTHSKVFTVTRCLPVQKLVFQEYGVPAPCPLSNTSCILINDPQCIKDNNDCLKKRDTLTIRELQKTNVSSDRWREMNANEIKAQVLFTKVDKAKQVLTESKRKYEWKMASLNEAKKELEIMKRVVSSMDETLIFEKCLLVIYNTTKKGKHFITFSDISFTTSSPSADDILLELSIKKKNVDRESSQILYVFEDQEISFKRGIRQIFQTHLCNIMKRKRRSIAGLESSINLSFYPFTDTLSGNYRVVSDTSEVICLSSNSTFEYVQHLSKALTKSVEGALFTVDTLKKVIDNIESIITETAITDDVVSEELKKLKDGKINAEDELHQLTVTGILRRWKQDMELFTASNNLSHCLNMNDCFQTAIENWRDLPSMLKVERNIYIKQIRKVDTIFNKIFDVPRDLIALKQLSLDLHHSIFSLKKMTSFCSRAPNVKLNSPLKLVTFLGDVIELQCVTESDLPVSYTWKHNNKTLLFENQSKLKVFIQNNTVGRYVCEVWNRAGRNISTETRLILQRKPILLDQPKDLILFDNIKSITAAFFECNVSSDPQAKISWYYLPYNQPNNGIKLHSSKPVLNIRNTTSEKSGFYYCIASNKYGSTTSRRARLDILVGEIPQQQLSVAFNMPFTRNDILQKKYDKKIESDSKLSSNQSLNLDIEDASAKDVHMHIDMEDHSNERADGLLDTKIVNQVSGKRQALSEGIQRLVSGLVDTHSKEFAIEMERTMSLGFDGTRCGNGRSIHSNGYTCVPCQAGSYEFGGQCLDCPLGSYQTSPGQTECASCDANQVTKKIGTITDKECVAPVLQSMDIMILLDSSNSLSSAEFKKVQQFVVNFIQNDISNGKNLKFGLISYDDHAKYIINLASQGNDTSLLVRKVFKIKQSRSHSCEMDEALHLAMQVMKHQPPTERRKVIVSFIAGNVIEKDNFDGFDLVRIKSLDMQKYSIQSLVVRIGSRMNHPESLALATMPKESNIIGFKNGDLLINSGRILSATILKGECVFSGKDIAISIESSSVVDDELWSNTLYFVGQFIKSFRKDKNINFGFISYGSKIVPSDFKSITTVAEINQTLSALPRANDHTNIPKILDYIYNSFVTERFNSLYNMKIIILFTKIPVTEEVLGNIKKKFYYDDVRFLNVVLTLEKQDVGVSDIGIEESRKSVYSLSEASELIYRVKGMEKSIENNCMY